MDTVDRDVDYALDLCAFEHAVDRLALQFDPHAGSGIRDAYQWPQGRGCRPAAQVGKGGQQPSHPASVSTGHPGIIDREDATAITRLGRCVSAAGRRPWSAMARADGLGESSAGSADAPDTAATDVN